MNAFEGICSVAPTNRSGSASTSATVEACELAVIEWQFHGGEQDTAALPLGGSARGILGYAGSLDDALGLHVEERLSGLGTIGREEVRALLRRLLSGALAQRCGGWACGDGVQCVTVHCCGLTAIRVLHKRIIEDWRAFKDQALGSVDHAIDDRTVQKLPAGTDHLPAEALQPAAIVQGRRKRSVSAPSLIKTYK